VTKRTACEKEASSHNKDHPRLMAEPQRLEIGQTKRSDLKFFAGYFQI